MRTKLRSGGTQTAHSRGASVAQAPSDSQAELDADMVQPRDAFEQQNIRQTHVLDGMAEQTSRRQVGHGDVRSVLEITMLQIKLFFHSKIISILLASSFQIEWTR
jgi:hypothetical protein